MRLKPPQHSEARRVVLFLAAGLLNTAFGYAVYASLVALGGSPALSVVISTIAGVAFNFRVLGAVFAGQGRGRLPRFIAVYAALTPLNIALIGLARYLGIGPYLGEALALTVVTPLTYLAMRNFVFARSAVSKRLA